MQFPAAFYLLVFISVILEGHQKVGHYGSKHTRGWGIEVIQTCAIPKIGKGPITTLTLTLRWPKVLGKSEETDISRSRPCFRQAQTRQIAASHSALRAVHCIAWSSSLHLNSPFSAGLCLCFHRRPLCAFPDLLSESALSTAGPCSSNFSISYVFVALSGSSLWAFASFLPTIHKAKGTSLEYFSLWWACYAAEQHEGTFSIRSTRTDTTSFAFEVYLGEKWLCRAYSGVYVCFFLSLPAATTRGSCNMKQPFPTLAVCLLSLLLLYPAPLVTPYFSHSELKSPIAEHNVFQNHPLRDRIWGSFTLFVWVFFLATFIPFPFMYLQELTCFWHWV